MLQVPQIEIEEQVVEVPVAKHVQVQIQKVQMVDVPQVEYDDQVVDVPVQKQVHIPFQQARGTCAKAPKAYKHHRSLILESCIWQKVLINFRSWWNLYQPASVKG